MGEADVPGVGAAAGPFPVGPLPPGGHAVCLGRLDEWARGASAGEPVVRARSSGSRLLLRHAVAAADGTPPHHVVLDQDGHGRPVLRAPAGLDVSISHTADVLVVGVARGRRIGVDVEARDRPLLAPGLAEKFCHPEELAELRELPPAERNALLVRLWTLKEAYTKALGVGLAHDFARLRPRPVIGGGWWLEPSAPGWRLRCDPVMDGFIVARALGPDGL
ncbi:4'-phosphopantetheinyl transferase superfamily protein [Streptomyces cinnabarinus]|uniref:4'-phosphopantetheinyl transferase superfamily protein n=1 Tax=Streptomyces cinnabarinus TaxID=67287 RepID=A0ABY7KPV5_9ACTN|nr:4'-phosphopantetheinyl transferase superfamily protein [Streptomyces cinnabarinus]WAZ25625.1 4'-phosphopantetheinyl transferase superfamily protein [Streptomyces cinnabarinus]